jgi:CelD/BcsL family acetyltransferase involved in cellulose biosynthesis
VERCERRLAEHGPVEYLRYRPEGKSCGDGDPRWDLYDACATLARQSWQGSATDGTTLSHESVRAYLRDAHQTAAAAGGLDLNLLLVDGRPAAFAYNYHYRGHVYGLRAGFDSQVATEGSGTVLLRRIIEESCRRGDHLFDLGPGSLNAKRHWHTRLQTCYHYPHYAPANVKAQALRMKRWLTGSTF